jgi:hypothetical protein
MHFLVWEVGVGFWPYLKLSFYTMNKHASLFLYIVGDELKSLITLTLGGNALKTFLFRVDFWPYLTLSFYTRDKHSSLFYMLLVMN